ncbi:tetratricopeptide repeat protein [Marinimicrobium alkaliphilum]|uniref:tetratricopeptide repeat protein n=1 Tax=Marinimicrobium alkaliphilum TaxID=2202654 RepID=UPI0013003F6C|nr:tetratricopeptide repeat protein [Marinimicrobium alkaliphilum]
MGFTNPKALAALLWATLLTAGCASPPPVPTPAFDLPEEGRSPALPAGPVTANPYLAERPRVSDSARDSFADALAAMTAGHWLSAQVQLERLTQQHPRLSGPWVNLGLVHRALEDDTRAQAAFEQALSINPRNLDAWNQLGLLRRSAGDFEGARAAYQRALDVWPFHADSHRHLAILYDLYLGQWDAALDHYLAYQQLLIDPEPALQTRVAGWIIDLERRIAARVAQQAQTRQEEAP